MLGRRAASRKDAYGLYVQKHQIGFPESQPEIGLSAHLDLSASRSTPSEQDGMLCFGIDGLLVGHFLDEFKLGHRILHGWYRNGPMAMTGV